MGESGCGKSTLAKTILGIHSPTKGKIYFEGRDLSTLDKQGWKEYRSNIGYIQQDPYGALPHLHECEAHFGRAHEDQRDHR